MPEYLEHARRHLPEGSDPLLPGSFPTPFAASYVSFSRIFTAVPANTSTVFDLSTATDVSCNEAPGALPGSSWSGTNFSYDLSTPNYVQIGTGVYVYRASIWIGNGSTFPTAKFSAVIQETGTRYAHGDEVTPPYTHAYLDPGFSFSPLEPEDNLTVDRVAIAYFTGNAERGMTFAHNSPDGAQDIAAIMFVAYVAPL